MVILIRLGYLSRNTMLCNVLMKLIKKLYDISKMMILKGRKGVQREIHSNDEGIHSLSSLIDDGVE